MKCFVTCLILIAALIGGQPAGAVTLDFEGLADLDSVTTQFGGLTFSNTIALVSGAAGGSLNEISFPPNSGVTVVSDDGAPITITFDTPVASVSGFFTYVVPVTITAFDSLLSAVASDTSLFSNNTADAGDAGSSPNELLEVAFAAGISSLTIEGDLQGGSFVLDDLTFVPAVVVATPEMPSTALLTVVTAVFIAVAGRPRRRLEAVKSR